MFAYCNNNPVMLCDCTGTCAHNGKTWDCVDCMAGCEIVNSAVTDTKVKNYDAACLVAVSAAANISTVSVDALEQIYINILNNAPKPNNIGWGTFNATKASEIRFINNFSKGARVSIPIAFMVYEVLYNANVNIQNNEAFYKIAYDAGVDILLSGGSIWATTKLSMVVGSLFCPGVGTAVGAIAGVAITVCIDVIPWFDGLTCRQKIKSLV